MSDRKKKWRLMRSLKLEADAMRKRLRVKYQGKSEQVYYDICDVSGKILRTGHFHASELSIDLDGFDKEEYIFLLMDGKHIRRKRFSWNET